MFIKREDAEHIIKASMWGKAMREALAELDAVPSADAIPMDWLNEQIRAPENAGQYSAMLSRLKRRWHGEEAKAQDSLPEGE